MYPAEAAAGEVKAGSLLVNAAVKEGTCFQLLNEDDIFRYHPNPRLIHLLLTSFQSPVWSPAAFCIFALGYFYCHFSWHCLLTSFPYLCHRLALIFTAVNIE